MKSSLFIVSVALLSLALFPSQNLLAATFEILFPVDDIYGNKTVFVSDNGSRVLGANNNTTYLWERGQGIINTWNDFGHRSGMSGDGQTILVNTFQSNFFATDADYDASVIVGYRGSFPYTPTAIINGQEVDLGELSPTDNSGRASAVSSDGSTIVGVSSRISDIPGATYHYPFRWTANGGMTSLGLLPTASNQYGIAHDVSGDGSVVVGYSSTANNRSEGFRWTEATGMQGLGDLPGGPFKSEAYAVSANGQVIVGRSYAEPHLGGGVYDLGADAFIWTESNGMQDLRELLINDYGLDIHDYRLRAGTGVSANGNIIVGVGGGLGMTFAWRVNLVPEPSTLIQVIGTGIVLCIRRRRE